MLSFVTTVNTYLTVSTLKLLYKQHQGIFFLAVLYYSMALLLFIIVLGHSSSIYTGLGDILWIILLIGVAPCSIPEITKELYFGFRILIT